MMRIPSSNLAASALRVSSVSALSYHDLGSFAHVRVRGKQQTTDGHKTFGHYQPPSPLIAMSILFIRSPPPPPLSLYHTHTHTHTHTCRSPQ
jgi:hypothetical protein